MVSILLSSNNPNNLKDLYHSVMDLSEKPTQVELIVYVNQDDPNYNFSLPRIRYVRGPKNTQSEMWFKCYQIAIGPIYGYFPDNILFKTQDWDKLVKNKFKALSNKLALLQGDNSDLYGFIHTDWINQIGRFIPEYPEHGSNEAWMNRMADISERRIVLPELKFRT